MKLRPAAVAAALLAALLLAGCGSDSSGSPGGGSGGGSPSGPCDVTDQKTVASVFPGANTGKPGKVRNCEYTFAGGKVNVYLFDGDLDGYKQQAKDNDISFTPVSVGDAAIRDQIHTLTVQQGDTLFAVQALPSSGLAKKDLAKYDPQTLALAKKIAADL
ncbi:hypothetical protein [Jatrophihabitans fulvus]